jgi:4-hydroxythreonine-4-phosphate dehydrogenase
MTDIHPLQPLVVSAGEPAGIGPDLCLGLATSPASAPIVIVADPEALQRRADRLSLDVSISLYVAGKKSPPGSLCVLPVDLAKKDVCGLPDPANVPAMLDGLNRAITGCENGEFAALVTGPIQKSAVNECGIPFTGHTEYLANRAGGGKPVMLLVAGELRVALVSTHLPLREVADYITPERLRSTLQILHAGLVGHFGIARPMINVCGLNPHAGENGHLGHEDRDIIAPVLDGLRNSGLQLRGPLPADTAFTSAAGPADAVLAMYHDQGLPVLKYAGFGKAVNVTLGLPFVRTSVDHGTALDIAGSGRADPGSLHAAIDLAVKIAQRKTVSCV